MWRAFGAHCRIFSLISHKAAIDENDAATGKPRRCEHPVTRPFYIRTPGRAGGVSQRFLAVETLRRKSHTAKFLAIFSEPWPACAWWQILRAMCEPLVQR